MSNYTKIIRVGPREGEAVSVVGDVCRILALGQQTGGVYALHEIRVSPHNGPPPHIHSREDECSFVLEGEVDFQIADEKITAKPGTFIHGPRGVAHGFRNNTERPTRMLVFINPAGFENFVKEFAHPVASFDSAAIPASKDDIEKPLTAAARYGIQILAPKN